MSAVAQLSSTVHVPGRVAPNGARSGAAFAPLRHGGRGYDGQAQAWWPVADAQTPAPSKREERTCSR